MTRTKLEAFEITYPDAKNPNRALWVKVGKAYSNRDGSINLFLDVLPLSGRVQVREVREAEEVVS